MCNKKVAVGRFTNVCCLAVVIRQVSCTLYGTCWRFSSTVLDGDEQVLDEDDGEASVFVPSASPPSSSRLKEAAVPSHTLIHVTLFTLYTSYTFTMPSARLHDDLTARLLV